MAAGVVTFKKKEVAESNGGWHLAMTITYGGTPAMPHVPMKFSFTPTAYYERYLDDAHGDKPQMRKQPLVGQMPIIESVDVDFADPRGKIWNKTMFDFTVTRAHNFSAGEYSVSVRRADGVQVGSTQTIVLAGDNPVIDRRSISFVATGKGSKKKAADAPSEAAEDAQGAESRGGESAAAPTAEGQDDQAPPSPAPSAEPATPGADVEKVPPSARGCSCRTAGSRETSATSVFLVVAFAGLGLRRKGVRRTLEGS